MINLPVRFPPNHDHDHYPNDYDDNDDKLPSSLPTQMYNNFSPPSGTRVFLDSGRRTWSSRSPCLQLMIDFLCWYVIWLIIVTIVTIVTFRVLRFVGLGWCSQSTPSPTFFAPGFHSPRYPCDQAWSSLIRCRRWGNRSWSSSATRPPTSSSSSFSFSSRKGLRISLGRLIQLL